MASLVNLFSDIGAGLHTIVTSPNTLYGVYLIAFFFGIWVMVNVALQKAPQFKGKPAKVIAVMFSIIVTGAIFYGKGGRTPEELLSLFNGFGGFIFILFLSLLIAGGAFYVYFKTYREQKKIGTNAAMLILAIGLYIAATLLLPVFTPGGSFTYTETGYGYFFKIHLETGGYIGSRTDAFIIFFKALQIIIDISVILMIIFFIKFIWDILAPDSSENNSKTKNKSKSKEDIQRQKDIKNIKSLIQGINSDLRETNTRFNNKINLLNDLRRQIGNYRMKGGKK